MDVKPFLDFYELQSFRCNGNCNYSINGLFPNSDIMEKPDNVDRDPIISGFQSNFSFLHDVEARQPLPTDLTNPLTEISRSVSPDDNFLLKNYVDSSSGNSFFKMVKPVNDSLNDVNVALIRPIQSSTINLLNNENIFSSPHSKSERIFSVSRCLNFSDLPSDVTTEQGSDTFKKSDAVLNINNSINFTDASEIGGCKRKQRRYRYIALIID